MSNNKPRIIAEFELPGTTIEGDDGVVYTGPYIFVRAEFTHGDHARAVALLTDAQLDVKTQIMDVATTPASDWAKKEYDG